MSVSDCLSDLKADYRKHTVIDWRTGERLTEGWVHDGIMTCAVQISEKVRSCVLSLLADNPGFEIAIVGHSLGGGTAALLVLHWLSDPEIMQHPLHAYAYAPPSTNSPCFTPLLQPYITSCVHGNDLVPRLCFGSVRDLCEMMFALDYNDGKSEDGRSSTAEIIAKSALGVEIPRDTLCGLYQEVKARFSNVKLVPPGNVFQIYHRGKLGADALLARPGEVYQTTDYVGAFLDPDFYAEIIFSRSMLSDHMPDVYETVVDCFVSELQKQWELL